MASLASLLTCTRASTGYAQNAAGLWLPFSDNVLRATDLGILTETARTNIVLHCRDLANAAWTKSNVTATKNQTGIDGVSNSASSITATSANGTALQTITSASALRCQTAFVKRLVGSGAIQMTMDNGSTWTAVTVTSSWTRVTIPNQTLTDPTVGFRLAVSGDSIAVDFVQNENASFASSPIATTSGSATRAADDIKLTDPSAVDRTKGTFYVEWVDYGPGTGATRSLFGNRISGADHFNLSVASDKVTFSLASGGVGSCSLVSTASVTAGLQRAAVAYAVNDFAMATSVDAGALVTDNSGAIPTGSPNVIGVGELGNGAFQAFSYIKKLRYRPARVANALLQQMALGNVA
jgi:hypothetical protein